MPDVAGSEKSRHSDVHLERIKGKITFACRVSAGTPKLIIIELF